MKVKAIRYAMLRKTGQYENDRAEVEVELQEGDTVAEAVKSAKKLCEKALKTDPDFEYEGF